MEFNISFDTGAAGEKSVEAVSAAVQTLFGPAAKNLGLLMGETTGLYRLKNLYRIHQKREELDAKYGPIASEFVRQISIGESVRAAASASFEEEESVQDMWARLLRNAQDNRTAVSIEKLFVDLLDSLSAAEAIFLNALWHSIEEIPALNEKLRAALSSTSDIRAVRSSLEHEYVSRHFGEWRSLDIEKREVAVQNLIRLQCVSPILTPVSLDRMFTPFVLPTTRGDSTMYSVDPHKLEAVIKNILDTMALLTGLKAQELPEKRRTSLGTVGRPGWQLEAPELQFRFTPLGTRLMRSCTVGEYLQAPDDAP